MQAQSIYQSWLLRRKRLEQNAHALDPAVCKELTAILDPLIAAGAQDPRGAQPARFPTREARPPVRKTALKIRARVSQWRELWEQRARRRIEPVLQHLADEDAQSALWEARAAAGAVAPAATPRQPSAARGARILSALLHADLIEILAGAVRWGIERAPELLFMELRLPSAPAGFARLASGYIGSMWALLSHSDRRDTVDYMVGELAEINCAPDEFRRGNAAAPGGAPRVFLNHRALLIHAYARELEERTETRGGAAMADVARRVLHPVRDSDESGSATSFHVRAKPFWDTLVADLRRHDPGDVLDDYSRRLMASNDRSLDAFAASFDHRLFLSDDVIKTFYLNLVYVSKAMTLLAGHRVEAPDSRDGAQRNWLAGAAACGRDQLHDLFSEILLDPVQRQKALERFRVELADGSSAVRYTAIAMLGRLGTLDDIGLLVDLAELLPHGPGSRPESRLLVAAAQKLAAAHSLIPSHSH